jgi:hypothetical protein
MSIWTPKPKKELLKYRSRLRARMQIRYQKSLNPQPLRHQKFDPVELGNGMTFDPLMGIVTSPLFIPATNNEPPH